MRKPNWLLTRLGLLPSRDVLEKIDNLTESIDRLTAALQSLETPGAAGNLSRPASAKPSQSPGKKTGISVAIIGARGHGQKHIDAFKKLKNCHISYICDVDTKVSKAAAESIFKTAGYRPKTAQDYRDVLKDKSVDAVVICTPHHWHALSAIETLRAGKHVYIEKPITHNFEERWAVLAVAQKYGRIVQAGTQLRSNTSLEAAGAYMRAGKLGQIELVHCIVHKDRPPVPLSNQSKIPSTVDYSLWSGPAEPEEVNRSKFHYHWHWLWRFGNGALGNNGVHRIDAARIALDLKGYGDLVVSLGDRYGVPDSGETPNNMLTLHKFGETWILQDILGLKPEPYHGMENAVVFYGSKGTIVYKTGYAALVDDSFKEISRFEGKQLNHRFNFLDAIRKNDQSVARGDLEEGIISSDLCHFGNASWRAGTRADFDAARAVLNDLRVPKKVYDRLDALARNLQQNDLKEDIVIGEVLKLLKVGEKVPFHSERGADAFLSETYQDGFKLPSAEDA